MQHYRVGNVDDRNYFQGHETEWKRNNIGNSNPMLLTKQERREGLGLQSPIWKPS